MNQDLKFSCMVAVLVLLNISPAASIAQYRGAKQTIKPTIPLTALSGPINLRNIPVYSGAVFKDGCFHSHNAASETYYSQQVPKKIMDWYVDQIEGQGWTIILKSPTMLMAQTKDGDRCKVQVRALAESTGYRSSIVLTRAPI